MTKPTIRGRFLEMLRDQSLAVRLYLVNGVRLEGFVSAFDDDGILLQHEGRVQLVYRHAISTVMPTVPVQLDWMEKAV